MNSFWIFGYGSLVWRADFEFESKRFGFIRGFHRRFWQSSTDHRGTVDQPGRVVTLITTQDYDAHFRSLDDSYPPGTTIDDPVVWGVAYQVSQENRERVLSYLNYREKNGYTVHHVTVQTPHHPDNPLIENVLVYVGTVGNTEFAGPAPVAQLAERILRCSGPSGPNVEYLIELWLALKREWQAVEQWYNHLNTIMESNRKHSDNDPHLERLIEEVLKRLPFDSPIRQRLFAAARLPLETEEP